MHLAHKYLSAPLSAQLEVADTCNHKCLHCYNLDSNISNRQSVRASKETVVACAQKLIDGGIFAVVVTGGEPLVCKELTKEVIMLFKQNKVRVSLNTNLTLLDDDFLSFIANYDIGILTSCPSTNPNLFKKLVGIDNYRQFEKNVKQIVSAGIRLTVNMVVTKDNLTDVRTTALQLKNLGVKSFAATPMSLNVDYPRLDLLLSTEEVLQVVNDLLWIEKELGLRVDVLEALPKCVFPKEILSEKHAFLGRKCQAGRTTIAVSCNGDVRPCAHNPNSYGNILKEDICQIWSNMSDWRSLEYVPEDCRGCTWIHRCNGGCRTNAKTLYGKWDARDAWVTKPILDVPFERERKKIILDDDATFQVNKDVRFRREYEDVMVFYNIRDNDYFMVNDIFYDFILDICSLDVVTIHDLKSRYNIDDSNKMFFNDSIMFLIQKGILKELNPII